MADPGFSREDHWLTWGGGNPNSFIFMQFSGKKLKNNSTFGSLAHPHGENPGSATEDGANFRVGGAPLICKLFAENCMKMTAFWIKGGGVPGIPVGSATGLKFLSGCYNYRYS